MKPTETPDTTRILRWLRAHPDSSVMEIRFALFISNVTARMSDCRKDGFDFTKRRDEHGIFRYSVIEPGQGTLGLDRAS
jgi:hypothetical protein